GCMPVAVFLLFVSPSAPAIASLSLHDALPILERPPLPVRFGPTTSAPPPAPLDLPMPQPAAPAAPAAAAPEAEAIPTPPAPPPEDRKSTRLNSSPFRPRMPSSA